MCINYLYNASPVLFPNSHWSVSSDNALNSLHLVTPSVDNLCAKVLPIPLWIQVFKCVNIHN